MSLNLSVYKSFKKKVDLFLSVKQFDASRQLIENRLTSYPCDLRLTKDLALIPFYQGKTKEAIGFLEQLSTLFPEDKETRLLLLTFYCDLGQYEDARKEYIKIQESSPPLLGSSLSIERLAEEFVSCGLTFFKSGLYSRALVQFSQALTIYPSFAEAAILVARCQMKQGKYDKAVLFLKDFVKSSRPNAETQLWLGVAYFKQGKHGLAGFHLERSKELNPNNRLAQLYLDLLALESKKTLES